MPSAPFFSYWKNETEIDRNISLKFGDVETTRYHEEILKFEFDNEIVSEHFVNYCSLSIKGCSAQFFPNPKIWKWGGEFNTLSLTLLWWIKEKCINNTHAHVSFGSVFDRKKMYLLEEAPSSITQMSAPNNIYVRLTYICYIFFVPTKMFALIGWLYHLAIVKI